MFPDFFLCYSRVQRVIIMRLNTIYQSLTIEELSRYVEHGLGKVLGGLGVEPTNKLAVTWGAIKANR